ncbi:MAG: Crp/Fnr family transcriptional regulator [Bacteroidia bacterium]|nr:Crp/Fnr family transcriptional regulator [Bacteroidia bacterium]
MQSPLETLIRASVKNPLQEEINAIEDIFTKREFKKSEVFKKNDSISKELAFVLNGSARSYMINSKGDEVTSFIIQKNHFLADLISVRTNEATPFTLHFLEDSTALVASITAHRKLLETNLAYNILIREHMADEAMRYYKRQLLFLTGTAKDRYQFIVDNYPQLLREFPLKYIASLIGITPTQLSRLRNKK